jgi:hypothetical protein
MLGQRRHQGKDASPEDPETGCQQRNATGEQGQLAQRLGVDAAMT